MKTITLEEIYADPHVLDALLESGKPLQLFREGTKVGNIIPLAEAKPNPEKPFVPFDIEKHRAWFLATHGPDAYNSTRTSEDIFDELRRERRVTGDE